MNKITKYIKYLAMVFFCLWLTAPFSASAVGENASHAHSVIIKLKKDDKIHQINLLPGENVAQVIKDWKNQPNVDFVEPNYDYQAAAEPNDPLFGSQWYLSKVNAPGAWDTTTGSNEVVVAVLDTGIDINHPDLSANIWTNAGELPDNNIDDDNNGFIDDYHGWDFIGSVPDPLPKYDTGWNTSGINHGTAIAGVIGAVGNNNAGIAGMNWSVKLMPIRVLDGAGVGDTGDIYQGIDYAIANGADFINLSFVGNNQDVLLSNAINEATQAGILVFAAAGNNNINLNSSPRYPVCDENVIGVGGTDQEDTRLLVESGGQISVASNYGSDCIDISAPGENFISTSFYDPVNGLDNPYLSGWSGTSMATPMVAGAAALIKASNPTLSISEIKNLLLHNSDPFSADEPLATQLGSGRLNIGNVFAQPVVLADTMNIITGAGQNGGPHVRIINTQGSVQSQFFAYAESFRGGVNVAAGDVNGDGTDEIIAGAGNGGGPHVRIFDQHGNLLSQFFAYAESFRGGVNVASGDVNGDGTDEIIAGAGNGGGPHVRIFDQHGNLLSQFFAYAESFRGGVNVAVGDFDNNGVDEIVTGAGNTGGPHVRVFNYSGVRQSQFFAYAESFRGGVNVAAGDVNGDGTDEIIAGAGYTGGPHVRIFGESGNLLSQFFAYAESFRGGVNVAAIR